MATDVWRDCLRNWPAEVERRGVLVTVFGEQIAFNNFATSDTMLLVERIAPDTVGARTVLVDYQQVAALKLTDVVKMKSFQSLGFVIPTVTRKP
jgi:hypothetical protein